MFNTPLRLFVTVYKQKSIQRHHICMTYYDYDDILDGIERRDKIEFEINLSGNSD